MAKKRPKVMQTQGIDLQITMPTDAIEKLDNLARLSNTDRNTVVNVLLSLYVTSQLSPGKTGSEQK